MLLSLSFVQKKQNMSCEHNTSRKSLLRQNFPQSQNWPSPPPAGENGSRGRVSQERGKLEGDLQPGLPCLTYFMLDFRTRKKVYRSQQGFANKDQEGTASRRWGGERKVSELKSLRPSVRPNVRKMRRGFLHIWPNNSAPCSST